MYAIMIETGDAVGAAGESLGINDAQLAVKGPSGTALKQLHDQRRVFNSYHQLRIGRITNDPRKLSPITPH